MLQKLNTRRGGFTLVEIMIVVAIIALLATFGIPSLMRARKTAQATACKNDIALVDKAMQQWAAEKNKKNGDTPVWTDLKPYMNETSRLGLAATCTDSLGSTITIPALGTPLTVPTATYSALSDVQGADFWSPYAPAAAQ